MEFLLLPLGIAGMIWGAVLLKRGGLLAGALAVMLAGVCFGVEFYKLPMGAVPLTADRLILVVLVGQYLLWRRFGWADPKPLGKPELILCAFTAVMVFSTFNADFSTSNFQPVSWLILFYLMPFAIYWIVRQSTFSERAIRNLFLALTIFGGYLAITSLAEFFEIWWAVYPSYIRETAAKAGTEFVGRARGPFLNPIGNGIALSVCFGASLMLWPRFDRKRQLLILLPLYLLFLAAIYTTMTRSVWMGGTLTLALIVGLSIPWNWRMPLLVGGLVVAVLVSVWQWDRLVAFKRDKNLTAENTADSVELRPVLARIAWNMFHDRPLFGCGYAQYINEHTNYLSDSESELDLDRGRNYIQHNVFFSMLTETGLLGLGMYLVLNTLWGIESWRLWRSARVPLGERQLGLLMLTTLSVYFVNGLFHDVSVTSMANMTLFFMAGTASGAYSKSSAIASLALQSSNSRALQATDPSWGNAPAVPTQK